MTDKGLHRKTIRGLEIGYKQEGLSTKFVNGPSVRYLY